MKTLYLFLLTLLVAIGARAATPIRGVCQVDSTAMTAFVRQYNPNFDPAIARAFHEIGNRYGIRGDIALCQAILETGWFRFDNGTAVAPSQHNYCGMGVIKTGDSGCNFESVEAGVTALIQHLYAYCCSDELPEGEVIIDPRYKLVKRGSAPCWEDLVGRWAMNTAYAVNILINYERLTRHAGNR
ncbi:MAG: glucosaminidase domain-containing protein [Muribaculaceae bacterium]|nr:glucosaminidase domain-containing protein [Muribaculaceae bacterium]